MRTEPIEAPTPDAFARAVRDGFERGAAIVPIDPRLAAAEQARRRELADAPDGTALVVFTSGTTAQPRPVFLTRANVEANARGVAIAYGLHAGTRWLCPLPLTHVGGLMVVLRCALLGATSLHCAPADTARALRERDATIVSLVPTLLKRLLDDDALGGWDGIVMLGGGPADPELLRRARAAGLRVSQTYGLTEACSAVTVSAPGEPETAGRPIPGVELALAPDGEILVSGPTVAPAAGPVLRTGDLGALDAEGRLRLVGRKANTIITGGENVAPEEVEAILLEHPAVADAAVVGRPDPEWGERLHAIVVARGGAARPADAELAAHCRARIARFKIPKSFEWRAGPLPRTASGKLVRRALDTATDARAAG